MQGEDCDSQLKNSIEGIIIKWAYQVRKYIHLYDSKNTWQQKDIVLFYNIAANSEYQVDEVLSKNSADALLDEKVFEKCRRW